MDKRRKGGRSARVSFQINSLSNCWSRKIDVGESNEKRKANLNRARHLKGEESCSERSLKRLPVPGAEEKRRIRLRSNLQSREVTPVPQKG